MLHLPLETDQFSDLKNGNLIQLNTTIDPDELESLKIGAVVEAECKGSIIKARVVSKPLVMVSRPEQGEEEVTLEVRKF